MRTTSVVAVPAAVLGLVALAACGSSSGPGGDAPSAAVTSAAASAVTSAAAAAATSAAAGGGDYSPIPVGPALSGTSRGLDFGRLTKITVKGGVVTLHVDRAHFYAGAQAKAHNKGVVPLDGVLFQDTDGNKEYAFTLDPKASIQAEGDLQDNQGNTDERVTLTRDQFIRNMTALQAQDAGRTDPGSAFRVLVWLRHTDGPDGPVTALADQFLP